MLYGAESWSTSAQMNQLINSFATSAYRIMTAVKRLDTKCAIPQSSHQSPGMSSYTQYMIDNCASLVTCSETHSPHASTYAPYQPTHGTTRRGRPRLNYMDYMERLTGMKTNELVEVSQDRDAWRELVVACVDLQPPD